MPFLDEVIRNRKRLMERYRRISGEVSESRFPVRPAGSEDISFRDNAKFTDNSLLPMWGFAVWDVSEWEQ